MAHFQVRKLLVITEGIDFHISRFAEAGTTAMFEKTHSLLALAVVNNSEAALMSFCRHEYRTELFSFGIAGIFTCFEAIWSSIVPLSERLHA